MRFVNPDRDEIDALLRRDRTAGITVVMDRCIYKDRARL